MGTPWPMILLLELLVVKCVSVALYICMIIGQEKSGTCSKKQGV